MLIAPFEEYCDYVKAGRSVVFVISGKPGEGCLADLSLLEGGDSQLRDSIGESFTALDFDKNNCFAILGDDIDLTPLAAEVTLDNPESDSLQECCCQLFATIADPGILLPFATFPSHGST